MSDPESIDFQQVLATLHAWIGKHVFVTVGAAGRRPYAACWTQGTLRRTTETTVHTDLGPDREAIDFNLGGTRAAPRRWDYPPRVDARRVPPDPRGFHRRKLGWQTA